MGPKGQEIEVTEVPVAYQSHRYQRRQRWGRKFEGQEVEVTEVTVD